MTHRRLRAPEPLPNPYADLPAWARTLLKTASGRSVFAAECTLIRQQDLWSTVVFPVDACRDNGHGRWINKGAQELFDRTTDLCHTNLVCNEHHAFIGTHLRFDAWTTLTGGENTEDAPASDGVLRRLTFKTLVGEQADLAQGCILHWQDFRELLNPIVVSLQAPLAAVLRVQLEEALYFKSLPQSRGLFVQAVLAGQLVQIP